MKLSQLKKVTYEEIKNKQYEKLRETMGEDIELYFKESGQFIGYQEMEMDSKYLDVHEDISYLKDSVSLHSHIFYLRSARGQSQTNLRRTTHGAVSANCAVGQCRLLEKMQ